MWIELNKEEVYALFQIVENNSRENNLRPYVTIYNQLSHTDQEELNNTFPKVTKSIVNKNTLISSSAESHLINKLTKEEYEEIRNLKDQMLDAVNEAEVNYFSNKIHAILDIADRR